MYLENFRKHPVEQLSHFAIGTFVGIMLTGGHTLAGLAIMAMICSRQGLEWAKRDDTPGIDLAVYLAGILVGVALGLRGTTPEDVIENLEEFVDEIRERHKNRPR